MSRGQTGGQTALIRYHGMQMRRDCPCASRPLIGRCGSSHGPAMTVINRSEYRAQAAHLLPLNHLPLVREVGGVGGNVTPASRKTAAATTTTTTTKTKTTTARVSFDYALPWRS